jgi:uncharacterized protein YkwD
MDSLNPTPRIRNVCRKARFPIQLAVSIGLLFATSFSFSSTAMAATPAELISNFRLEHGEGKVSDNAALDGIAREQAEAMAAKDVLSHEVLGPFGSRVAKYGSARAAENVAYGYDNFPKTLDQWIRSSGHRSNLLLHGASYVGVASAKSTKSNRTYWAMVIAAPVEKPKRTKRTKDAASAPKSCRLPLSILCP